MKGVQSRVSITAIDISTSTAAFVEGKPTAVLPHHLLQMTQMQIFDNTGRKLIKPSTAESKSPSQLFRNSISCNMLYIATQD